MKRLSAIFISFLFSMLAMAQTPETMSYQAVIRNSSNQLVVGTEITLNISILNSIDAVTPLYAETQKTFTNANGLISVKIGSIVPLSGIDWADGPYFIRTEVDIAGGSNFTIIGTSELLSVPYAFHSKTAESLTGAITETDPVFSVHPANGISNANLTNWNTAYSWGDHATAGYLNSFTETDPIFLAHPANSITNLNLTNWNSAYGWGDHSVAGYLTSFTELDPIFTAHPANGISNTNLTNWNSAYSWGDHAIAGYLTSFTETDPIFGVAPASSITNTLMNNWSIAYTWGNHANAGYLKSFTELDGSISNEIQTLSLSGNNLTISGTGGNTVALPIIPSPWTTSGGNIYRNTGSVGIGTTTPLATLDVNGDVRGTSFKLLNVGAIGNRFKIGTNINGIDTDIEYASGWLTFMPTASIIALALDNNGNAIMGLGGNKVGVGTATPTEKLEVNGSVKIVDGTQGAGKVLTSDPNGKAAWGNPATYVPIGSVMAWHKNYANTPALSTEWMECNGQVVNDISSPYNGQALPNLNANNYFIRGATTSGTTGGAANHTHSFYSTGTDQIPDASNHPDGAATNAASNLPPYFQMVWIMKIK